MLYQVVTIICLAILFIELFSAIIYGGLQDRPKRVAFVRSFKKGKCTFIYLTTVPLYFIGHYYTMQDPFEALFSAIPKTVNLVILHYDTTTIAPLMQANPLYRYTVYFAFALVAVNALLFTVSLTYQRIWCAIESWKALLTSKDKLYLLGYSEEFLSLYTSDTTHSKAIVDEFNDQQKHKMFLEKIVFIDTSSHRMFLERMFRRMKISDKTFTVIINTGSDESNMTLCRFVIDSIEKEEDKEKFFGKLRVFVFGDPLYTSIYEDIVADGYGCIQYFNKHRKVAVDFVDKYPLAQFMDERHLDYDTSLVREGVDINVVMLGFGKTNHHIFMTSLANNQFLQEVDGKITLKPVSYHIFDGDGSVQDKNLNHSYYRFERELSDADPAAYLPLPSQPAEEIYYPMGVDHSDFYPVLRSILTKQPNDANFVIIDVGTDLENIDIAQKLVEKRGEWDLSNLTIFVKVSQFHRSQSTLSEAGCYLFGCEKEIVYDIDAILEDKMTQMAKMRNQIYDLEYTVTNSTDQVIDGAYIQAQKQKSERNWYLKKSQMERDSSIYCCLSLRSKLLLMGLDYVKENDPREAISATEYMKIYAGEDIPALLSEETVDGKPILAYGLDFKTSRRKTMAIHEHERWNSFMISHGMIPSTLAQIEKETTPEGKHTNGKNYAVRRHGNLTTFEGLETFRKMVAQRDGVSEASCDVIKYDYQILDDAHWLLTRLGYKIVKK